MSFLRSLIQELPTEFLSAAGFAGIVSGILYKNEYQACNLVKEEGHNAEPDTVTPLDPDSEKLCSEEVKSIKLFSKFINYFTSKRPDVTSKGTPFYWKGVYIGVPYCFRYKSVDEIQLQDLQFLDEELELKSEDKQKLFETMIYTELEKRFAISQEIYKSYSALAGFQPCSAVLVGIVWYTICYYLFQVFSIKRHVKYRYRLFLYLIGSIIGVKALDWGHNRLLQYRDISTIKKITNSNQDVALAGLTYYQKCLERNKILYSLPNNTFRDKIDSEGNFVNLFYERPVSLTERHYHLVKYLTRQGLLKTKVADESVTVNQGNS